MATTSLSRLLCRGAALVGLGFLAASPASAELLGYSFTDVNGDRREVPPDETYVNPYGDMIFALRAGVDRRLEIELRNNEGDVLSSQRSDLIGANDRIQHGGETHYGAVLSLDAPEDGDYYIHSKILTSSGSVVAESVHPMTVVRAKPYPGEIVIEQALDTAYSGVDLPLLGHPRFRSMTVEGISSAVPLDYVVFQLKDENGRNVRAFTAPVSNGQAAFVRNDIFTSGMEGQYRVVANVFDVAGNNATTHIDFLYDSDSGIAQHGRMEPVAIYDPSRHDGQLIDGTFVASGYVPYSPGMGVSHNPIRAIYKVKRENFWDYSPFGIGRASGQGRQVANDVIHRGDEYVYIQTRVHGQANLTSYGEYSLTYTGYDRMLNSHVSEPIVFTLLEDALIGPQNIKSTVIYSDGREVSGHRYLAPDETDIVIVGARVEVAARPYRQRVRIQNNKRSNVDVIVPAGETIAYADLGISIQDLIDAGDQQLVSTSHRIYGLDEGSGFQTAGLNYRYTYFDAHPPEIIDIRHLDNEVVVETYENQESNYSGKTHNGNFYVDFNNSKLEIRNSSGGWVEVPRLRQNVKTHWYRDFYYNLASVVEGHYLATRATIEDRFGNQTIETVSKAFVVDRTAPEVNIQAGSRIASLDQITLELSDNLDPSPRVTNVRITGGPANDNINLATTRRGDTNTFGLEYPIIFPTLQEGEDYTLEVTARDASGNTRTATQTFTYDPPRVSLAGGVDGKLMIPAVPHEFRHLNGRRVVSSEPLTLGDGATVAGVYDVYATLRSDAEVPLVVNGVRINPGDTTEIMASHDFSSSDGRLAIPMHAADHGVTGMSGLLISTTAPNAPVLTLEVHAWMGEAALEAESWSVRQVVDPVRVHATPGSGNMCRFTASESEARAADPIHDPTCYLQWDSLPDETDPVPLVESGANAPRAEGQAVALGEHEVAYSLWLFSGDGTKVKVGEGSRVMEATSPYGSVSHRPLEDYSEVTRLLEEVDLRLTQSSGPTCNLTLSAEEAIDAAANRKHDAQRLTCLLDWQTIPTGLRQHESGVAPRLRGHLAENGDYTVGWRISVFSKGGTRLTLNHEDATLTAVDPEAPIIDMLASRHVIDLGDGTYVVPIEGSHFADLDISALPTEVDLRLTRDEEVLEADTFGVGWSNRNRLTRRLNAPAKGLWETTDLSASVYYHQVPDIGTEVHYQTITGPAANVAPLIEVAGSKVLDNEPLPLAIQITDPLNPAVGYVPERMGEWEVRLANQRALQDIDPLTEWTLAEDGRIELDLDLAGSPNASLRLVAQARLVSPIDGLEREVVSPRPVFLTVLRGGAIDGEVNLRTMSGEAPFIAAFTLGFANRLDQAALGDVVWEVSADGGGSWERHIPEPQRKRSFLETFEEGIYQVRAHLTNRHSGLESYTEVIEVVAYAVPRIAIEGPQTLFVGDSWTYEAGLALPEGSLADLSDVVVEWSLDGGETWPHEGPELTLSRDEEARIGLRARARTRLAPEEDRRAYDEARTRVEFRDARPPRARLRGPMRVEPGEPYTFTATVSAPYRGMAYAIDGYFTLPNGEIVEGGTEVEYIPTAEDVESGRMTMRYTGWFEGFKDQTQVNADYSATVWEYIWPEFYFAEQRSADVAPAEIALTVMHRRGTRRLEGPVYDWHLPDEARGVVDRGVTRIFWIDEPGTYPISVTVSDERGHESTVELELVLGRPDPYDIELSYTASNRYERAPLDVRVRSRVRGGHPRDRIIGHRYYNNGEVITDGSMYGTTTLEAGTHYLMYELETQMGTTARQILPIEVAENQPPVCELEVAETSRDWRISADCQDPDGRVREYHWEVDGEVVGRSGYRLSLSKRDHESLPTVQVIAVDDAGDPSEPVQVP